MRVLGIDPGSRSTGFGIVNYRSNKINYVTSGHIKAQGNNLSQRLKEIFEGISAVILNYKPDCVAIEQVFVHKNVSSALKLGHARGAAMVAVANYNLEIAEYTPRYIKKSVVGYGGAEKEQVQQMVMMILGIENKPQEDAADALACAICHSHQQVGVVQ
ncbi:MAG: crossover junction endodeoxyribonuclease RuvC [Francisellaceae bacterium]|jgi:crossover junction endodeoxyribonuclease RuvC|nr:crossover junction endodeoxyribonuclease RuvC [Francisellaceae bacterium]MBT6206734.1 crossover junction endodeoxyribonuclease RuvC [Francisellaceae bacterium]MBT6538092.1 crossover junction endodeoxyribonuclease RuvC [Francisellaceae bacterium]